MPDVVRASDGALMVCGVDLDTARAECARLNAEANVRNPETGQPVGMHLGELARHEIRSDEGLVVL